MGREIPARGQAGCDLASEFVADGGNISAQRM